MTQVFRDLDRELRSKGEGSASGYSEPWKGSGEEVGPCGLIISAKLCGDAGLLIKVFTNLEGVVTSFLKANKSSENVAQVGNVVKYKIYKRNQGHLGLFKFELIRGYANALCKNRLPYAMLMAICETVLYAVPEGDRMHSDIFSDSLVLLEEMYHRGTYDAVYNATRGKGLGSSKLDEMVTKYLKFEIDLVKSLGFCDVDLSEAYSKLLRILPVDVDSFPEGKLCEILENLGLRDALAVFDETTENLKEVTLKPLLSRNLLRNEVHGALARLGIN